MQKTVVFGRKPITQQNVNPTSQAKSKCKNCEKLQAQIVELSLFSTNCQTQMHLQTTESETIRSLRAELLNLREQYVELKKKLTHFEKENDQMFEENSKLTRHLKACQIQLKELLKRKKQPLLLESQSEYMQSQDEKGSGEEESAGLSKFDHQKIISELQAQFEKQKKEAQVQLIVWKEKTQQLQILISDKNCEIDRLKELLRRRNKIQDQRHMLLERICC